MKPILLLLLVFTPLLSLSQENKTQISEPKIYQSENSKHEINKDHPRRFIKFEIKNNTNRKVNCYVKGKKPGGGKFSYGFPMSPGQIRQKDWSIGSTVYLVSTLGVRKKLKVIQASDEGQVVDLFEE